MFRLRNGREQRAAGVRGGIGPVSRGLPSGPRHGNSSFAGEVAEWSKAHAWKVCRRETVSRVESLSLRQKPRSAFVLVPVEPTTSRGLAMSRTTATPETRRTGHASDHGPTSTSFPCPEAGAKSVPKEPGRPLQSLELTRFLDPRADSVRLEIALRPRAGRRSRRARRAAASVGVTASPRELQGQGAALEAGLEGEAGGEGLGVGARPAAARGGRSAGRARPRGCRGRPRRGRRRCAARRLAGAQALDEGEAEALGEVRRGSAGTPSRAW